MSQFCEQPTVGNWTYLKHIFHYLNGTKDYKLKYEKTGQPIKVYGDADWANDRNDSKSITGYVVIWLEVQ